MLDIDFAAVAIVFILVWSLIFVLRRVFFNPIDRVRSERQALLGGDRDAFRNASDAHENSLKTIEATLKSAKSAAEAIRAGLEAEAFQENGRIVSSVSGEYRSQVLRARQELDEKIKDLKKEMEVRADEFAETIEKRLLN
ncbi:MAG: hypothetical protein A2Y69_13815 [Candidatus Aminicenantes bacterium RBG_13_59_9]|nr:MAG: hypothetical protein A2Y69_13815 [Candidatus Aminicenantes bacterium RBG_13_59_9]